MHKFKEKELVERAFNHRSTTSLKQSYERLEFIGNRVIGLVVADMLLSKYPMAKEGELARRHIAIVRAETLADIARTCGLGDFIRVSDNKEQMQQNDKILSDITEACVGALFRDGGLEAVRPFVEKYIEPLLESFPEDLMDNKTKLQEWSQKNKYGIPVYEMTSNNWGLTMILNLLCRFVLRGLNLHMGGENQNKKLRKNENFMKEHNI